MERCDVRFTGQVQGVGFRYTTCRVARQFEVTGWVQNLPDGSVRCVAEGVPEEVEAFVAAVRHAMSGCVADVSTQRSPATGEFDGFDIKY